MNPRQRGLAARLGGAAVAVALALAGVSAMAGLPGGTATAQAAGGTGTGFLSTRGTQIVDARGTAVRLTGINWFGMETSNNTFHGLWARGYRDHIDQMASLGFNTIRVPYSNDALRPGAVATSVDGVSNPDLQGLSPLQILDRVIEYAGTKGMRILLDRHRPTSGGQSALWYVPATPESTWIADWRMLAQRYRTNPTVIGADLHNEPHAAGTDPNGTGACWGCGDTARDWRLAAERAGNAIHEVNPDWLIVVEGVSCPSGGDPNAWDDIPDERCGWWGGNLSRAGQFPVRLARANKLVYSPHEYATSVFPQSWFNDPTFPANMPAIWDQQWGYIERQGIAPLLLGEFGSTLADPRDVTWLRELMRFTGTGVSGMDFTYWSWNPNSGDTGGIVADDWRTVVQSRYSILQPFLIPPVAGGSGGPGTPPTTLPAGCTASLAITNAWSGGFQANLTVRNTGGSGISPWTVTWTLPAGATIGSAWPGPATQSGTTVTAQAPSWNPSLPAGGTTQIGFTANGPSTPAPSTFRLNGTACGSG